MVRYSVAMPSILLSDLVDEWSASQRSNAYAKNTVRNGTQAARGLLALVGNIQVANVTSRHVDAYFADLETKGRKPSTLNVYRAGLRSMFAYAVQRRYVRGDANPVVHRRPYRAVQRDRLRIPATEFRRLLDCADHPRDRIIVALGLYLFLRRSEIQVLRVSDVSLELGEVAVEVIKTRQFDNMPISSELDRELRNWLTYYSANLGRPLRDTDFLVPAKTPPLFKAGLAPDQNVAMAYRNSRLDPTRPVHEPELAVQRALKAFGYPLRDKDGDSLREGVHTLRRSGARALFDHLVETGYDGAMRTVQSMLHHASVTTTELYLGIHLDKKRRDELVRGKAMFPVAISGNVISLEDERGKKANLRDRV